MSLIYSVYIFHCPVYMYVCCGRGYICLCKYSLGFILLSDASIFTWLIFLLWFFALSLSFSCLYMHNLISTNILFFFISHSFFFSDYHFYFLLLPLICPCTILSPSHFISFFIVSFIWYQFPPWFVLPLLPNCP